MSYDGLYYDQLPQDIQEAISAEAGAKAEEEGLQKDYQELLDLYAEIQQKHEEFIRFYCNRTDENIGCV